VTIDKSNGGLMGLLDFVFPGKTKMEVAANIINANYNLNNLPPEINKKALHDVIQKLFQGFNQETPENAYAMFLGEPSKIQLNTLSLAYQNINIAPLLNGEYWRWVKNPFLPTIYDDSIFEAVKSRMSKQYGINLEIPREPITSHELSEIFSMN
jgi:hypothetical protein